MGRPLEFTRPEARGDFYRDCATQAFLMGKRAKSPALKAECINLAAIWHTLAVEMECAVVPLPGEDAPALNQSPKEHH
jgi:hypothetical protein